MEYSIQQIARAAGVTSRTLRHYDEIGLLRPSRVGGNGYRYYDDRALVRLQRILLLRDLGLGLDAIGEVLVEQDARAGAGALRGGRIGSADPHPRAESAARAEAHILGDHLELLRRERQRIEAQIGSVERTIAALLGEGATTHGTRQGRGEGDLMAENIFDGFDHTRYREEVEERWGADAYAQSDRWWRELGDAGRAEWKERTDRLAADWSRAAADGEDSAGEAAQRLAARHVEWLRGAGGTPAARPDGDLAGYVLCLGEMYVADERFAANYGGVQGAVFVRDALRNYVERELR